MRSDYMKIKKAEILRIFFGILIAVFILSFEGVVLTADAIDCGDSIGPGETVTLRGDLGPCGDRVLTVEGPARLNLNGFTLNCGGEDGIRVNGERAIIQNGTVMGCDTAVDVRGDGHHQIVNLTLDNNEIGIRLRSGSGGNHVINNTATNNSDRGFRVDEGSDDNKLINNFAEFSNKGFRIDGDNNNVVGNEANNNSAENFQIKGNNNRFVNNSADGGVEECFLIEGNSNELINNAATNCKESGFELSNEDGGGDHNKISNCTAIGNQIDGIFAWEGAVGNFIIHNTALENGLDLRDEDCDNNVNVWKKNNFETSNDSCIE